MAEKKVVLTYEGLKNMEAELENLKTVRRKDVAEKIKEARGQGDLSENAEYDAAKEEQAEIEARIVQLEKMLRNAEVIDEEGGAKTYTDVSDGMSVSMGGMISAYKKLKTRSGAFMAFVTVEDLYGSVECVCFPKVYEKMQYTIVGSAEADPMNGRISNESPVGMALIGHKEGDSVSIDTPDGEAIFKVLKIAK